jgi:hypothetical protein
MSFGGLAADPDNEITKIIAALKLTYGEKIARWCQTPRTTSELKQMYEAEEQKGSTAVIGGLEFTDYLSRLEQAGAIKYADGKWNVLPATVEILAKYFG